MREIMRKAYYDVKNLPLFIRKKPFLVVTKQYPIRPYIRNIRSASKDTRQIIDLIFIKLVEYEAYLTGFFKYFLEKTTKKNAKKWCPI